MCETYLSFKTILLVGGAILAGIILLVILLLSRRKSSPASLPQSTPVTSSPEERQTILQKLADGELSKAEAEEQLNQLGDPVPVAMPAPTPRSGAAKGCLTILFLTLILPVLFAFIFYLFMGMRIKREHEFINQQQIEQFIQENHGRNL